MSTPDQAARTRATLQRIRTAFLTLLHEKPLHRISVKELCGVAGVSRGTFYVHYRDVYDLLSRIEAELTGEAPPEPEHLPRSPDTQPEAEP